MPGKRRESAFSKVMREAQTHNGETAEPENRKTVLPLHGSTVEPQESETASLQYRETPERLISGTVTQQNRKVVEPQDSKTVSQYEKVSFYITAEQALKLDDLAHDFRRAYGKRINRNDIVRYLLDQVTLKSLEGMTGQQSFTPDLETAEIQRLKDLLDIEKRFHSDTEVRYFKKWLRSHDRPQDSDFAQRVLNDSRLPMHASRAMYEAKMRLHGYTDEDVHLFEVMWKDMLVELTS